MRYWISPRIAPHLSQDAGHAEHGPAAVHTLALSKPSQALLVGAQAQGVEAVCRADQRVQIRPGINTPA